MEREFDPRREARRQLLRVQVPDGVEGRELDAEVRADLRSLAKDTAELTAQHLVMAGRLIDDDPVQALAHARAATALAGRVGVVREAAGLTAYAAGEWALALSELRTARRVTGRPDHLAVLADCERALGRPERALAALDDPDVKGLDQATRVELVIVVAGARRDLGELEAAVLLLQTPAMGTKERHPWAARLWYAYADALEAAGRPDAREWFERAAAVDEDGSTGALDRLLELDGVVFAADHDGEDLGEEQGPSTSLEELGLGPASKDAGTGAAASRDSAAADGRAAEHASESPAGPSSAESPVTMDGPPEQGSEDDLTDTRGGHELPAMPEAAAASSSDRLDEAPGAVDPLAPPAFSDEPIPLPAPAQHRDEGVPGQQELFSDLGPATDR